MVALGSLVMFMSFALLMEHNVKENGFYESTAKQVTILCSGVGLTFFFIAPALYFYFRLRKSCTRNANAQSTEVSIFITN